MKAEVLTDRVALEMFDPEKYLIKGGIKFDVNILLSDLKMSYREINKEKQERILEKFTDWPFKGKVVSIGEKAGEVLGIGEGDVVYTRPGAGLTVMLGGKIVTIVTIGDIYAKARK